MVDIHSHILPGLDDGAEDEATALEMCRIAAAAGTREIVATPHNNLRYPYDVAVVTERIARLQEQLGHTIFIHRGCDLHLTWDNIAAALEDPKKYSINGSQYQLVEFADDVLLQGTAEVFRSFSGAGIVPIVTHPERNPYLRKNLKRLAHWIERGCLIQITGGSLLGVFGQRTQAAAFTMVEHNLVHFVASDAHNCSGRNPALGEAYDFVVYRWGEKTAERLFIDHPWAALWGEKITPPEPKPEKRSIWQALFSSGKSRRRRRHR